MADNTLVSIFGWSAALFHGDTMTYDRWRFVRSKLPMVKNTGEKVLDVGCGSGAITMGVANRGYETIGLSWDEENQKKAVQRAKISGIETVSFPVGDARKLDQMEEYKQTFDCVLCCEVIEHILDDVKLMRDIVGCLKPGGKLILTTPNAFYRSSEFDAGPWEVEENGGHVRRGYTSSEIKELCELSGLRIEEIGYISFLTSQVFNIFQRKLTKHLSSRVVWLLCLIPRIIPVLMDRVAGSFLSKLVGWPGYSITLVAYKPRHSKGS